MLVNQAAVGERVMFCLSHDWEWFPKLFFSSFRFVLLVMLFKITPLRARDVLEWSSCFMVICADDVVGDTW